MALNQSLFAQLELYGLSNNHLEQLLALCQNRPGKAVWHIDQEGFAKLEISLYAPMRDTRRMRELTHLLQKG